MNLTWLLQSNRGRKKIEKDPNAEDKEKPYVCEGWKRNDSLLLESWKHILSVINLKYNTWTKQVDITTSTVFYGILIICSTLSLLTWKNQWMQSVLHSVQVVFFSFWLKSVYRRNMTDVTVISIKFWYLICADNNPCLEVCVCSIVSACGARYKTRPGLAYHYTHFHNGLMDEEASTPSPKPPARTSRSAKERELGNSMFHSQLDWKKVWKCDAVWPQTWLVCVWRNCFGMGKHQVVDALAFGLVKSRLRRCLCCQIFFRWSLFLCAAAARMWLVLLIFILINRKRRASHFLHT